MNKKDSLRMLWLLAFIPIIFFQIAYMNTGITFFGFVPILYSLILVIAIECIKEVQKEK